MSEILKTPGMAPEGVDAKYDDSGSLESQNSIQQGSLDEYIERQLRAEEDNEIKYRTCSWQKTAALLFSEYICLAIMSFPWSYSILGLVPGLIITVFVSLTTLYTGLVLWEFCLKNPQTKDICDIGQILFWGKRWAWYFTAVCFLLNNTFIQGLHVLTGAEYLNTISNHGTCTVAFAAVVMIICIVFSLPRTFSGLSSLAVFSAATQFISIILAMIFAGIQDHPGGYDGTPVVWNLWPEKGTTYVAAMSAFLNIVYTFVGQITYPSFIAEMKNPRDFPKALYSVVLAQVIVFALVGSIMYVYVGNQYMVAPAYGALIDVYKKISFSFTVPTLIFLGVLYASVSCRFLMFRIFRSNQRHLTQNTALGWAVWTGLVVGTWVIAFIIAEVIPFFSDLLSLLSSLFDCWFGFVFWGMAWFYLRREELGPNWFRKLTWFGYVKMAINIFLIGMGLYILGPGTYATVQSIINSFKAGTVSGVFKCASNGL
uniref:ARAD1D29084p n=1 Tax=Blastobotrys adeninivorans TaxID=409370 RepID=A0A060TBQ7_BLAAD